MKNETEKKLVWLVNKNVNWEREVVGVYTNKEQAELHLKQFGGAGYLTVHVLDERHIQCCAL